MAELQDALSMTDKTLEKWGPYLLAACQRANDSQALNLLYTLEVGLSCAALTFRSS